MKKITLIALMLFTALGYAQVGINTNNPDASSALEIESTTGGILIPRLTETQRNAITAPAIGLMIYQTNGTSGFYFYDGAAWTKIDGVAGPQGTDGADGTDGVDGADGNDGATGATGATGALGATGATGADGASYTQPTYLNNTFYAELGGYVIQISPNGKHGLVVAMQDQGFSNWYEASDILSNASNHDADGKEFSDWRLPTKRELNLMYGVFISGNAANFDSYYYWSSTETDSDDAWFQDFYDGTQTNTNKFNSFNVRAVRAF